MHENITAEPLVLTNEDKAKNVLKRLTVYSFYWILCLISLSLLGWTTRCIIAFSLFFLTIIWTYVDYKRKKKSISERIEYLRIDKNGVRVNGDGVEEFIKWKNIVNITFYSWRNHVNFYHISIVYKEDGTKVVIRMDLQDYNEIVSCRKWKKAIIQFSGREDIVGNKHTWLVLAKEDND